MTLENRVANLEDAVIRIENRFDRLETMIDTRFVNLDARMTALESRTTTICVTMMPAVIGGFCAMVVATLVIGQQPHGVTREG